MDRVTRNMIYSIPRTQGQQEVFGEDGTRYTIETCWEEGSWDSGSQQGLEDGFANTKSEYIITTVKSGSLERKPFMDYQELPDTPGRLTETYTLVDDDVHRAELWVPSPDRDSKLELVRKGELYDLRAYKEERKPAKLFSETDEEVEYRIVPVEVSPVRLKELEEERKSIINAQTPKRRSVRSWHSSDELGSDAGSPPASPTEMSRTSAVRCSLPLDTSKPTESSLTPESVDTEQINFVAARQQFMMLEKQKPDLLQGLKPQSRPPKLSESTGYVYERDWHGEDGSPYPVTMTSQLSFHLDGSRRGAGEGYHTSFVPSVEEEMFSQQKANNSLAEPESGYSRNFMRQVYVTSRKGELDSDSEDDIGTGYGNNGNTSHELSGDWQVQESGNKSTTNFETPIEKEIRLALEREEELRRERGIKGYASTQEMVAILKTPLLYRSPPSSPGRKVKENRRGSYFVQREIEKETKREEDLKSEGKVVGLYDKGPLEELGERKKMFEQQDDVPVLPNKTIHYKSLDSERYERNASFVPMEMLEQDNAPVVSPEVQMRNRERISRIPMEAYEPFLASYTDGTRSQRGPSSPKNTYRYSWHPSSDFGSHSQSLQSQDDSIKTVGHDSIVSPEDPFVLKKEYFSWKPWTPVLSPAAPPQECPEERPPRSKQVGQASYTENTFTTKPLRSQTSSLIEKEIQEVLQREQELQQQRRMLSQRPFDSSSTDLSSPLAQDHLHHHQPSDSPDKHVVSLFSTPFRPLILSSTPDASSDTVPPEEITYQTYDTAQKAQAAAPSEWESRSPGRLKDEQLQEFEDRRSRQRDEYGEPRGFQSAGAVKDHRGSPDKHGVSLFSTPFRPLILCSTPEASSNTRLQEERTYQAYNTSQKSPDAAPSEWEPRTPGRLKDEQLEEFEDRRSRRRDEYREPRGFESSVAIKGHHADPPKRQVVSLFSTPFRPLVLRTTPETFSDAVVPEEHTYQTYSAAPKDHVSPPAEWQPRTPGKLRDEQLEGFEGKRIRQRDQYGEPRSYESAGTVPVHRGTPDKHVVSLFSTPFRPLVLRTAPDASSDAVIQGEHTYQTYGTAQKRPSSPPFEWEPRSLGKLKDSQLEEFEGRQSRQRDEYGYAGIDPSDDVNNEIVESTRVIRHKNILALRWEAGQYLNTPGDDYDD
ncbi:mitotic interactor and substrate of PLK1 [Ambystoma mexicanum]|uniref:mitotic interactor and substrate of PLK1 n=1 Tax=Ambystoma mexicanum TaxID=8296 RepID=UPI0037E862CC